MRLKKVFIIVITLLFMISALNSSLLSIAEGWFEASYSDFLDEYVNDAHTDHFFDESVFEELDYGIYWYDGLGITKAEGKHSAGYDPAKPTIIFIHGWQLNEGYNSREILYYFDNADTSGGEEKFVAIEWLNKGYNVGQFYWNQLADDMTTRAQSKIWTTEGGMRWKTSDGTYTADNDPTNPKHTVTELFVESYLDAMSSHKGSEIRLVGHSMGAQIATAAGHILSKRIINKHLMPTRISLLDPYTGIYKKETYTINWSKEKMNDRTMFEIMADYIEELANVGVAIDFYTGMDLAYNQCYTTASVNADAIGKQAVLDAYKKVWDNTVWIYLDAMKNHPAYSATGDEHKGARDYYFASFDADIYGVYCYAEGQTLHMINSVGISAASPTALVYAMRGKTYVQMDDNGTWSPNDDYLIEVVPVTKVEVEHEQAMGMIAGKAFNDTNFSGIADTGLSSKANITVRLYDNNVLIDSTTTDDAGWYYFTNLSAGSYVVEFSKNLMMMYVEASERDDLLGSSVTDLKLGRTDVIVLENDFSVAIVNVGYKYTILYVFLVVVSLVVVATIVTSVVIYKKKKRVKDENCNS